MLKSQCPVCFDNRGRICAQAGRKSRDIRPLELRILSCENVVEVLIPGRSKIVNYRLKKMGRSGESYEWLVTYWGFILTAWVQNYMISMAYPKISFPFFSRIQYEAKAKETKLLALFKSPTVHCGPLEFRIPKFLILHLRSRFSRKSNFF